MLAVQNMVILSRVISTNSLQNLIEQHQNMQLILVEVMQLNDSELLTSYQNLLEKVRYRHQKRAKECATIISAMPSAVKLDEVRQFRAFSKVLYKLLSILNG
jgi:N-acetyl-gamma-glutamylphosphate reductase